MKLTKENKTKKKKGKLYLPSLWFILITLTPPLICNLELTTLIFVISPDTTHHSSSLKPCRLELEDESSALKSINIYCIKDQANFKLLILIRYFNVILNSSKLVKKIAY